jgi:hypothetical protein
MAGRKRESGQALIEYSLLYAAVIVPFTFGIIYLAQLLWVWHSMVEFTRDGARYAATHCWESGGENVLQYMYTHVPINVEQAQFSQANANAQVTIAYSTVDPDSGSLTDFSCDTDCSVSCVPDVVTVSVENYVYGKFFGFLKLSGVAMPPWPTTVPMEGAGCDSATATCLP